jgi:hypothetical protein
MRDLGTVLFFAVFYLSLGIFTANVAHWCGFTEDISPEALPRKVVACVIVWPVIALFMLIYFLVYLFCILTPIGW